MYRNRKYHSFEDFFVYLNSMFCFFHQGWTWSSRC